MSFSRLREQPYLRQDKPLPAAMVVPTVLKPIASMRATQAGTQGIGEHAPKSRRRMVVESAPAGNRSGLRQDGLAASGEGWTSTGAIVCKTAQS
jgi:hypothetical protein